MTRLYSVEALVIRTRDFGEADKILTLYTREQGKVQAIAKGVRKPSSRLRGGVQLFSYSRMLLYRGKTMDTVTQAETVEAFAGLRDDLSRLIYGVYLAELIENMALEREPNEPFFILALSSLGLLLGDDPELIARFFEIRLLHLLGYGPNFSECLICHRIPAGIPLKVVPDMGGVTCRNCTGHSVGSTWISAGTALTLNRLLYTDPQKVFQLKISPVMRREMEKALEINLEYHLEKSLRAKKIVRNMLKELETSQ